jgi:CHAT domain
LNDGSHYLVEKYTLQIYCVPDSRAGAPEKAAHSLRLRGLGVAQAVPGLGFADAAFTEARLRSVLQDTGDDSVLHIGTHFSLRPGNVMRSFLVLGDGSRLSLDAISELSFSGIELVTLSARQVIASLWQVEDKSTALLMRELYEHLADSLSSRLPLLDHVNDLFDRAYRGPDAERGLARIELLRQRHRCALKMPEYGIGIHVCIDRCPALVNRPNGHCE